MTATLPSSVSGTALAARSLQVLADAQADTGAIVASTAFGQYDYCWFRDGAFIAHAMAVSGELDRAGRFHRWAAAVAHREAATIERAIADRQAGRPIDAGDVLDARYRTDGSRGDEPWPNFQLDGVGTWLWSLREWTQLAGTDPAELADAVRLVARYLAALWDQPSYDCWEEFSGHVHVATLAAVYGGLMAATGLLGEPCWADTATRVRELALGPGVAGGRLRKHLDTDLIDGSLAWVSAPFGMLQPGDPVMAATAEAIAADLTGPTGGIYRYRGDTYFGGGEWLPLAAHLGWHWVRADQPDKARTLLAWIESGVTGAGLLPEQTLNAVQDPSYVAEWTQRWGPVATPLTWSHAAYLILAHELRGAGGGQAETRPA
jgi:GH15 family glucan-1,4-alpha-glucosidase